MSFQLPGSLTPSKVSTFKECALAFRLSVIDKLPEPPSLQAFKGTVVHRALELLMWEQGPGERTLTVALTKLDRAVEELLAGEEGLALGLEGPSLRDLVEDARELVANYFALEDPNSVRVIGTELRLQVDVNPAHFGKSRRAEGPGGEGGWETGGSSGGGYGMAGARGGTETIGGGDEGLGGAKGDASDKHGAGDAGGCGTRSQVNRLRLRGIIDRLELDDDGELVVTDYKTGRAPGQAQEQSRLGGVHFYAFLCQQVLGKRPARVQLFHLREPTAICSIPSDQSISGLERQAAAIWAAVKRACLLEDFRPRPGPLCAWCGYHAYCPSMGGDLSLVPLAATAAMPALAQSVPVPEEQANEQLFSLPLTDVS
ncbi:MAG: RecB family exonuclease [Acidimicrobiales bacterium]